MSKKETRSILALKILAAVVVWSGDRRYARRYYFSNAMDKYEYLGVPMWMIRKTLLKDEAAPSVNYQIERLEFLGLIKKVKAPNRRIYLSPTSKTRDKLRDLYGVYEPDVFRKAGMLIA